MSLRRQGFAQLLVWMQKLKLCGMQGAGRWGGEFNYKIKYALPQVGIRM